MQKHIFQNKISRFFPTTPVFEHHHFSFWLASSIVNGERKNANGLVGPDLPIQPFSTTVLCVAH